jgi:hypothetical protein
MNKLLTTGLLLLCSLKCFPTCIVIYVSDDKHIYVAADSRRSFIFNDGAGRNKFESVCKIHNVGNSYFAIAGIDDGRLLTEATRALQLHSDIDTAIASFGTAMVKGYNRLMADMRIYYPSKFKHFLRDGLAEVSFFGFQNGRPNVVDIEFTCAQGKNGAAVSKYRIHKVYNITVIGLSRDITNAKPDELPSAATREQNPELYVEELVKIEAKMQPLAVSEPIDLLELSPDGPVWIRKNDYAGSY